MRSLLAPISPHNVACIIDRGRAVGAVRHTLYSARCHQAGWAHCRDACSAKLGAQHSALWGAVYETRSSRCGYPIVIRLGHRLYLPGGIIWVALVSFEPLWHTPKYVAFDKNWPVMKLLSDCCEGKPCGKQRTRPAD